VSERKTFNGKTVKDAINKGLEELGVTENEVIVTVLEQPSKGLFGLFGAKDAVVELEVRSVDPLELTMRFLEDVLRDMGVQAKIEQAVEQDGNIVFEIVGKDLGLVIGRRGQTLDALQLLVNVYANRITQEHIRIVLDAERFRERRRKTLQDLSLRLANQVVRTKKEVVLEPMPASERRIIHYQLQNHPKVKTMSRGEEPNRRIVITLKS